MTTEEKQVIYKTISTELKTKANDFLNSRKNANNLADIIQMFEGDGSNFIAQLLTIEVIFTELLKRNELYKEIKVKTEKTAEAIYAHWLQETYDTTWNHILSCMRKGTTSSRVQALVTASKLMQAEGKYNWERSSNYYFPVDRLKEIIQVLLDFKESTSQLINRFQEYCDYRDVQQHGLKILYQLACANRTTATPMFIQNFLELFDKILVNNILHEHKKGEEEKEEDKLLCVSSNNSSFEFDQSEAKRYANRTWLKACNWPMCKEEKLRRRSLLLLIERLLPILNEPHLTLDMLCDSLDMGGPSSMLALQGILVLVRNHHIVYPDIYDKLYAMYVPDIFASKYKERLLHVTDIFLSSTHLPERLVAAFAKRFARLALLASPHDASALLQMVYNLIHRHPALKGMLCAVDKAQDIKSTDPYIMEEPVPSMSRALGSSLWELSALKRHWSGYFSTPEATKRIHPNDDKMYDTEMSKSFKNIELNFHPPIGMSLPQEDRLMKYWNLNIKRTKDLST